MVSGESDAGGGMLLDPDFQDRKTARTDEQ